MDCRSAFKWSPHRATTCAHWPSRTASNRPPARVSAAQSFWPNRSEAHLEPLVGGGEPQPFVEAMSVDPGLVGGQLHEDALAGRRFGDCPLDHCRTETTAAVTLRDTDAFDLRPACTAPGQPGYHGELQRPHDLLLVDGDDEELAGIGGNLLESVLIRTVADIGPLTRTAERIVGQK